MGFDVAEQWYGPSDIQSDCTQPRRVAWLPLLVELAAIIPPATPPTVHRRSTLPVPSPRVAT
jgi:hypothetical protein